MIAQIFSEKPVALITASGLGKKAHGTLLLIIRTIYAQIDEPDTQFILRPFKKKDLYAKSYT